MGTKYVVDGDCCSSLAPNYGFPDYSGFYAAQSDLFRKSYPNPNQLAIGAEYVEPVVNGGKKDGPTDASHLSQVRRSNVSLRLRLRDASGKPLQVVRGVIKLGDMTDKPHEFTSLQNGLLENQSIRLDWTSALLKVQVAPPKPRPELDPAGPPASTKWPMPYPPVVDDAQFSDKDDAGYLGAPVEFIQWDLKIGSLPTFQIEDGAGARLTNLGYSGKTVSDQVRLYQAAQNSRNQTANPVTGNWFDINDSVRAAHDDP